MKFLTKKLDLTHYLRVTDQINSLKTLLLKPYQILMLDNQKKINLFCAKDRMNLDIFDNEFLSSEKEIHINLIQMIIQRIKENSLEKVEIQLYENLEFYIKKFIDEFADQIKAEI